MYMFGLYCRYITRPFSVAVNKMLYKLTSPKHASFYMIKKNTVVVLNVLKEFQNGIPVFQISLS